MRALRQHLAYPGRAAWERLALELTALGALFSLLLRWANVPDVRYGLGLTAIAGVAVTAHRTWTQRAVLVGAGLALAASGTSHWELIMPFALGLARAPQERGGRGALLGGVGAALGALWFLGLGRLAGHPWVVLALAPGLFLAVGLLPVFVEWLEDPLAVRLAQVEGRIGRGAQVWRRLRAALTGLPGGAPKKRLERLANEAAERLLQCATQLDAADASLASLDAGATKASLEDLRSQLAAETDGGVRQQLVRAAAITSDSLEWVDGMQRKRERLKAQLSLELALLEKLAVSVELTPTDDALPLPANAGRGPG